MSASAEASHDGTSDGAIPSIIRALVDVMPVQALEEVAHVLRATLRHVDPPRTRRLLELRFLALLLAESEHLFIGGDLPYVPSDVYDEERQGRAATGNEAAAAAPASTTLRARFGSWMRACHAAGSIDPDGFWVGPRQPWPHGTVGRRGALIPYTAEEARQAVRDCAFALTKRPRSYQYQLWRSGRVARLRAQGITPRIPTIGCIYRLLAPNRTGRSGWETVLKKALHDVETRSVPLES